MTMRFLVMHKVDAKMEAGEPPAPGLVEAMGKLVQESLGQGIFKDGAGLHKSEDRLRVRFSGQNRELERGPLDGENELVARFAMIRVPSMREAVDQALRFADILWEGEIEIGPVVEPWDLGLIPKPEVLETSRYLLLIKSDEGFETEDFDPNVLSDLAALEAEMKAEGILLSAERLAPSARARRSNGTKDKRVWVDGPFAESKELVAGFSQLELPDREAAREWADRYAAILVDSQVDIYELLD